MVKDNLPNQNPENSEIVVAEYCSIERMVYVYYQAGKVAKEERD
jgi:hypothetical protein